MKLDYDDLAECVKQLLGTRLAVGTVAARVVGVSPDKIDNLHTIESAAPKCAECGVRGFSSEMVSHPTTGEHRHRTCV